MLADFFKYFLTSEQIAMIQVEGKRRELSSVMSISGKIGNTSAVHRLKQILLILYWHLVSKAIEQLQFLNWNKLHKISLFLFLHNVMSVTSVLWNPILHKLYWRGPHITSSLLKRGMWKYCIWVCVCCIGSLVIRDLIWKTSSGLHCKYLGAYGSPPSCLSHMHTRAVWW